MYGCETQSFILKGRERKGWKCFWSHLDLKKLKHQRNTIIYILTSFARDVGLLPRCSWGLPSYGALRGVNWYLVIDVPSWHLKMGPICCSEMSVPNCPSTLLNILEERRPDNFHDFTAHTTLLWQWKEKNYDVAWILKARNACRIWWKRDEAIWTVWTNGADLESGVVRGFVLTEFRNQN